MSRYLEATFWSSPQLGSKSSLEGKCRQLISMSIRVHSWCHLNPLLHLCSGSISSWFPVGFYSSGEKLKGGCLVGRITPPPLQIMPGAVADTIVSPTNYPFPITTLLAPSSAGLFCLPGAMRQTITSDTCPSQARGAISVHLHSQLWKSVARSTHMDHLGSMHIPPYPKCI